MAGAALLGACTVSPDYELPQEAVVNAPATQGKFVGTQNASFKDAPLPPRWWHLYRSPALDRLIEEALAANTDLRAAEANLERSHALLAEARTAREPQLAFNFNPAYAQLSSEQYLYPKPIAPAWFYDVGLTASYEVDLFGRIKRGIEAAEADDEAVRAARDVVRVSVAAETAGSYADLCGAGAELDAAHKTLALEEQRLGFVRKLFAEGRATSLDFTRSSAEVERTRADIPLLEARQRNALFRLATLAGRPPATFDQNLARCDAPPSPKVPIPVGDGAQLIRRRPDVREAERALAAATAEIGVATADLYPRVDLIAQVGSTGAISDFLSGLTNRWALGPGITWQVNQDPARARIAQAEAGTRAALAQFDGVVLTALRETETALNVYARALEQDRDLRAYRNRAREAFAQASRLELTGRTSALDTLDAERSLAEAELAVAESASRIATDQVAIFLALGGGWETVPEKTTKPAQF